MASKRMSQFLELRPKLDVVVDFAVERDPVTAGLVRHRLTAGLVQVDDRKTAVAERHTRRLVEAFAIRPAVTLDRDHRTDISRRPIVTIPRIRNSGNATHECLGYVSGRSARASTPFPPFSHQVGVTPACLSARQSASRLLRWRYQSVSESCV